MRTSDSECLCLFSYEIKQIDKLKTASHCTADLFSSTQCVISRENNSINCKTSSGQLINKSISVNFKPLLSAKNPRSLNQPLNQLYVPC